jgi:hypothetical protein
MICTLSFINIIILGMNTNESNHIIKSIIDLICFLILVEQIFLNPEYGILEWSIDKTIV